MRELSNNLKLARGNATLAAQLASGTDLPASGSYIDVSEATYVHIIAALGVVHASDEPTLEPKCSDAENGTLDTINASLAHTVAADDDEEFVVWTIETESLPLDHHFLSVDVGGTVSNGSFAMVFYLLDTQDKPVEQTSTILPTTSEYIYAGGQVVTG